MSALSWLAGVKLPLVSARVGAPHRPVLWTLIAFLVGRYFATRLYGQTYGALYAVFLTGGAIGPGTSGYLQQATGDYRWSLYGAAALLVLASVFTLFLSRIVRPVNDADSACLAPSTCR